MDFPEFIDASIAEMGFATVAVGAPEGFFAYSVGFTELGHPEVLISGLHPEHCHPFFWALFDMIKKGKRYQAGEVDTELGNLPVVFRTLHQDAAAKFCCQAQAWYDGSGKTPTFLQMVVPDPAGKLPWQAGYNAEKMRFQRHLWVELH